MAMKKRQANSLLHSAPCSTDKWLLRFFTRSQQRSWKKRSDDEACLQKIRCGMIHFTNGTSNAYWAGEDDLMHPYADIDAGLNSTMVDIKDAGSGFDVWHPNDRISRMALPLLDLEDAIKGYEEALETKRVIEKTKGMERAGKPSDGGA